MRCKALNLTPNETRLMELFWELDKPVTSVDLSPYVEEWKNGYLQNLLKSLETKKMIKCVNILQYGRQFAKQYKFIVSKEQYAAKMISSLHFTPNSIPQISLALTQELSPENRDEIITELENIIAELKETE